MRPNPTGRLAAALAIPWLILALLWRPSAASAASPEAEPDLPEWRAVDFRLRDLRAITAIVPPATRGEGAEGSTWRTDFAGASDTPILVSDPFVLGTDLRVPVLGSAEGENALRLWVHAADDTILDQVRYHPAAATAGTWSLDTRRWLGRRARLSLEDRRADAEGWLGVGTPSIRVRPAPRTPTYGQFTLALGIVLALVLVPGLALGRAFPQARLLRLVVPLPGVLLLAAFGLLLWLLDAGGSPLAANLYVGSVLLLAAWTVFGRRAAPAAPAPSDAWPHALWGAAFATAVFVGVNPLPVASEFLAHTSLPGRMVASPPDHAIPYWTATYFHHGHDGREHRDIYFGEWCLTSRGPLVAFATTGLFTVFGVEPSDPPALDSTHWPLADDGAYLARILGWMCNALVVLGGARLLAVLGVSRAARVWTLAWLTLAPVTSINVVFLWPKLLAAFFLLLAAADLLEGRPRRAGVWGALGWLSHPVGALFLVPLGFAALHLGFRAGKGLRPAFALTVTVLVLVSPWLGLKIALAHPDPFFTYVLGDGHGYEPAASLESWLHARWNNLWYTVVPVVFFTDGYMSVWIDGPVSAPLRWTAQYAKTLPGHLGFSLCLVAYTALLRRRAAA
ncbi:MAG TPA: hypothetical protein VK081_00290, partial [Planctomycetota bacterium]|nr:hypothetical protein [Planctomycetota bacterium]